MCSPILNEKEEKSFKKLNIFFEKKNTSKMDYGSALIPFWYPRKEILQINARWKRNG